MPLTPIETDKLRVINHLLDTLPGAYSHGVTIGWSLPTPDIDSAVWPVTVDGCEYIISVKVEEVTG
jgi:hypothetical protein